MGDEKIRYIFLYKEYFSNFYEKQNQKVKEKILWTFKLIETIQQVPTEYLKHLEGTDGLYEIRVQTGSDILESSVFSMKESWLYWQTDFKRKHKKHPNDKLKKH